MKNFKNGFAVSAVVIIVAILAAVGGAYYLKNKTDIFSGGTGAEVGGWSTYTNSKFGYKINYPDNWQVGKETSTIDAVNSVFSLITISDNDNKRSVSIRVDKKQLLLNYESQITESVTIDGQPYTAYIFPNGYECIGGDQKVCSYLEIPIKKGEYWYYLRATGDVKSLEGIHREILTSFEFL
jgi:hypothetical protein